MQIDSREDWMNAAIAALRPLFAGVGHPIPERVRASCGFTSKGLRGKAIGQCWSNLSSKDGTFEIFIVPSLSDSSRVLDILVHELVHAAVGLEAKHGSRFRECAEAMHLTGAMKATVAGPEFNDKVFAPVMSALGDVKYPHAELSSASTTEKKQTTRMVKCECKACGYVARTTMKWLDTVGAPLCACNEERMEVAA